MDNMVALNHGYTEEFLLFQNHNNNTLYTYRTGLKCPVPVSFYYVIFSFHINTCLVGPPNSLREHANPSYIHAKSQWYGIDNRV